MLISGAGGEALRDPRDMAKAGLPESQSPGGDRCARRKGTWNRCHVMRRRGLGAGATSMAWTMPSEGIQGDEWGA
jgi:hypothetical protein